MKTPQLVPFGDVLPIFMSGLPLVKDFLEYAPVVEALITIVRDNLTEVNLSWLLALIADSVEHYEPKTVVLVREFLRIASTGESWSGLLESVGQEKATKIHELLSS